MSCIQYKETTHAVYAPTRIAVGTGYYAVNPLNYDSLIKEKTWVKNRARRLSRCKTRLSTLTSSTRISAVTEKDFTNFTYDPTL